MKITYNTYSSLFLSLAVIFCLSVTGCEGPAGSDGSQGREGPAGPIGPAGENGRVMLAGNGAPADDLGNFGDYYLDLSTSELYGPKTEENLWGTPINLSGQDGADGSQIFSGTTAPSASLGDVGDFYLNTSSFNLFGPKTANGWGAPINLQGNANVTLYIFDGHNFSTGGTTRIIGDLTETEVEESAWQVYLVSGVSTPFYWHVPGFGKTGGTEYGVLHFWVSAETIVRFSISVEDGPGEAYKEIRIIRTAVGNVVDNRTSAPGTLPPKGYNLDLSDYDAVNKYYGLGAKNTVRISNQ